MPQAQLFRLGADVRCADGDCGKVRHLVINPSDDAVTHLVIEPAHRQGLGKLVPLRLVDAGIAYSAKGEVRLRCTMAEFGQLASAEATYFARSDEDYEGYSPDTGVSWPYYAPLEANPPVAPHQSPAPSQVPPTVTVDTVPDQLPGEDEVSRGEHVHAKDGDIGHVQGIVVDAVSGRVTSVLLREGHLLGRRTVLIPRSAVAEVGADGFHLNITREQVQVLPHADVAHPAGPA
jgi:sporulation protein YlmC with PRC-barrel domain